MPQFNLQVTSYTLAELGQLQDFDQQLAALDFYCASLQEMRKKLVSSKKLLPAFTADPTVSIPYANPAAAGVDFQKIAATLSVDKFGKPFDPSIGAALAPVDVIFSPQNMTGATVGSITAFGTGTDPFKAFDGNGVSNWLGANDLANNPDFIGLLTDTPHLLRGITVTAAGDASVANSPRSWELQASNDSLDGFNGNWLTLSVVSAEPAFTAGESRRYAVSTSSAFKHFRLKITESTDPNLVALAGLELIA